MKTIMIALGIMITMSGSPIYDFKLEGLDGKTIDLSEYKGKKILLVNVASYCGYTSQYEGLEKLYRQHSDKLVIIGFPANNFGKQEPDSNEKILDFCRKDKGVSFPLSKKISVAGDDMHPLFKYLVAEAGKINTPKPVIRWNFTKFLVNEKGELIKVFPSKAEPLGPEIAAYLN